MSHDQKHDRPLEDGSSGATADFAVDGDYKAEDRLTGAPYARAAAPLQGKPDQLAGKVAEAENRQEALIDEAVEETFPGSDPISPKHVD